MTIIEIGTIFAVVLVLAKVIEILVQFIIKKVSPEVVAEKHQHNKVAEQIQHLYDLHNKYDSNGTPIWYVPRALAATQDKVLETCQSIANSQEKLADTVERVVVILDRIDTRSRREG